ncbi:MAG: Hydroxylamine reductase [Elusimicrobia bacterium ADurb.Bin231]|nr:MAG: Hydroxylamine reductase [Elusimicrobia bacterium ADurb.Bin231]
MFCFQCQETARNLGCTVKGVCGKPERTADIQDLLIYVCKGISYYCKRYREIKPVDKKYGLFICRALFITITNASWDDDFIIGKIKDALDIRDEIKTKFLEGYKQKYGLEFTGKLPDCAVWRSNESEQILIKANSSDLRINANDTDDVRSLRQLLVIGCKGIAAYTAHAAVLGYEKDEIYNFIIDALDSTMNDLSVDDMIGMVMRAGEISVSAMALLDEANTARYGHPEITKVNIGVRNNPGILISGHDLKDMEELLIQTEGTGVDVYTHGEMLPANYYPAFKKYKHFVGNYVGSWWHQNKEFETFKGPVILTTNCLIPVKKENTYLNRLFTTGIVSYPGAKYIPEGGRNGKKDFTEVIELAKTCPSPEEIETGSLVGGFAHNQVIALADKIVAAVKSGAIKRFIVMAGCDGRQNTRNYFTQVAEMLPKDTVILTAGCAKYRYNKLNLGDINGMPRVLDAGQCNDSYSLAVIALKLKEVFCLNNINDLPISFDIAWYEQKAVAVLLALLFLGVKGIRLGPTLPAFLSQNVIKVLVEKFDIKPIGAVDKDIAAMMSGK